MAKGNNIVSFLQKFLSRTGTNIFNETTAIAIRFILSSKTRERRRDGNRIFHISTTWLQDPRVLHSCIELSPSPRYFSVSVLHFGISLPFIFYTCKRRWSARTVNKIEKSRACIPRIEKWFDVSYFIALVSHTFSIFQRIYNRRQKYSYSYVMKNLFDSLYFNNSFFLSSNETLWIINNNGYLFLSEFYRGFFYRNQRLRFQ